MLRRGKNRFGRVGVHGRSLDQRHLPGGHLRDGDAQLSGSELATKRRVKAAIAASHERFYREHLAATTALPLRLAVERWFAVERWRARACRAGTGDG